MQNSNDQNALLGQLAADQTSLSQKEDDQNSSMAPPTLSSQLQSVTTSLAGLMQSDSTATTTTNSIHTSVSNSVGFERVDDDRETDCRLTLYRSNDDEDGEWNFSFSNVERDPLWREQNNKEVIMDGETVRLRPEDFIPIKKILHKIVDIVELEDSTESSFEDLLEMARLSYDNNIDDKEEFGELIWSATKLIIKQYVLKNMRVLVKSETASRVFMKAISRCLSGVERIELVDNYDLSEASRWNGEKLQKVFMLDLKETSTRDELFSAIKRMKEIIEKVDSKLVEAKMEIDNYEMVYRDVQGNYNIGDISYPYDRLIVYFEGYVDPPF